MGWYNEFVAPVICPTCARSVTPAFQISVGSGDFFTYNVGDDIFNKSHDPLGAIRLRSSTIAHFLHEMSPNFCAVGLGDCSECSADIAAVVRFENQRLHSATALPEPPEDLHAVWRIDP